MKTNSELRNEETVMAFLGSSYDKADTHTRLKLTAYAGDEVLKPEVDSGLNPYDKSAAFLPKVSWAGNWSALNLHVNGRVKVEVRSLKATTNGKELWLEADGATTRKYLDSAGQETEPTRWLLKRLTRKEEAYLSKAIEKGWLDREGTFEGEMNG